MAQGEEGNLVDIREGNEGDEFGEIEAGPTDGRLVSPLLVRALDDSLLAAQGTPTPAQIETEIARPTDGATICLCSCQCAGQVVCAT
jgi:hypothetical protein